MEAAGGAIGPSASCCNSWTSGSHCQHPCLSNVGRSGPLRASCVVADHCRDIAVLRRGRHSTISLAECDALGGPIVLKTYDCANIAPKKQKMAAREAVMLQLLNTHGVPHITQCWGACPHQGHLHILMEYCAGGDLLSLLCRQGAGFNEAVVACVFAVPLLRTLSAMHSLGVIHRDIKLENIFLDASGRPKLGDFDMAVLANEPAARAPVGTIFYMAPEVMMLSTCRGGPADAALIRRVNEKMDIWSMGVCLFELAAGYKPYQGVSYEGVAAALVHRHRAELPPHLSPQFRAFLERMLCYDVEQRASAAQLLEDPWLLEVAQSALRIDSARSLEELRAEGVGPGIKYALGGSRSAAAAGSGDVGSSAGVTAGSPTGTSCSSHDLCTAFTNHVCKLQTTLGAHWEWCCSSDSSTAAAAAAAALQGSTLAGASPRAAADRSHYHPSSLVQGGSPLSPAAAARRRSAHQLEGGGGSCSSSTTVTSDSSSTTLGHPIVGTPHHMRLQEPMWTPFACPVQQFRVQQLLLAVAPVSLPPEEAAAPGGGGGYSSVGSLEGYLSSRPLQGSSALQGSEQLSSAVPDGLPSQDTAPALLEPQEGGFLSELFLDEPPAELAAPPSPQQQQHKQQAPVVPSQQQQQQQEAAVLRQQPAAADTGRAGRDSSSGTSSSQVPPAELLAGKGTSVPPHASSVGAQPSSVGAQASPSSSTDSSPCTPNGPWGVSPHLVTPLHIPVTGGDISRPGSFTSNSNITDMSAESAGCHATVAAGIAPKSPGFDAVVTFDQDGPLTASPGQTLTKGVLPPAMSQLATPVAAPSAATAAAAAAGAPLRNCHSHEPAPVSKLHYASLEAGRMGLSSSDSNIRRGQPPAQQYPRRRQPGLFACFRGTQ